MANERQITVMGEGSAVGIPDRCVISLTLNLVAESSSAALDAAGRLATQVGDVLADRGVASTELQTTTVRLHDVLDREKKRVTARIASYGLVVTVTTLDQAGPLLAAVAEVAGDSLQVGGLQLQISDPRPLIEVARREAVADALDRARQLARAAGIELGPVQSIEEGLGPEPDSPRRLMSSSATPLPVEGGASSVTVQVKVRLAMAD